MNKYYGQWETDRIIEEYFPYRDGICVEVGAYDGIKGSNTKLFEDRGWATICIEPNPYIFKELQQNRNGLCLNLACDNFFGKAELEVFDFKSNIQSSLTSLRTDKRLINEYSDAINKRHFVRVNVDTLTNIFNSFSVYHLIDFISIDTEGTELQVLQGLDLIKYKPKLLVVENNYNDSDIEDYLRPYNYNKILRYKVNDFYLKV